LTSSSGKGGQGVYVDLGFLKSRFDRIDESWRGWTERKKKRRPIRLEGKRGKGRRRRTWTGISSSNGFAAVEDESDIDAMRQGKKEGRGEGGTRKPFRRLSRKEKKKKEGKPTDTGCPEKGRVSRKWQTQY